MSIRLGHHADTGTASATIPRQLRSVRTPASGGTEYAKNVLGVRGRPVVLAGVRDFLEPRLPGWDHLLMDQDDPEKRIAELERQLAEQNRIAELERQIAQAKAAAHGQDVPAPSPPEWPATPPSPSVSHTGQPTVFKGAWVSVDGGGFQQVGDQGTAGPLPPEAMERVSKVLDEVANLTRQPGFPGQVGVGRQFVFPGQDAFGSQPASSGEAGFGVGVGGQAGVRPHLLRRAVGGVPLSPVFAFAIFMVGGLILLIATCTSLLIPSSVLWTSGIVCESGYRLAESSSKFSYQPQQGYSSSYLWCVNGDSSYHANEFAIVGLQFVLIGLVLCVAVAVGVLIWRLLRKPS